MDIIPIVNENDTLAVTVRTAPFVTIQVSNGYLGN